MIYLMIGFYVIFSITFFLVLRPKIHSFPFLFFCYTFAVYFIAFFLFQYYPKLSTLIRLPKPRPGGYFNANYYHEAFYIFIAGFISFLAPFFILRRLQKLDVKVPQFNIPFYPAFVLYLIFNFFSFWIRQTYKVGLPTTSIVSNPIAEYSWYFFNYITLIFLALVLFKGLKSSSRIKLLLALFSPIVYGLTLTFLGWRSGFLWVMLILFHQLFFTRSNNMEVRPRMNKIILIFSIISITGLPTIFILSKSYRAHISSGKNLSFTLFISTLVSDSKKSFSAKNITFIYNRITGISPLFVTVAYENPDQENEVSFWKNIFSRGSYQPETYFGCQLMKRKAACPPVKTTYAPTGWSIFYIYDGLAGVIIGFFTLGCLIAGFEYLIPQVILLNENFIALHSILYAIMFPSMIFEGTIAFFLKRHLLSFMLAFITISSIAFFTRKTSTFFKKTRTLQSTEQ